MKTVVASRGFQRDLKKLTRRGKDLEKLYFVIETLAKDEPLAARHKPHPLKGTWRPRWDCHIEPDWLLIYEVTENSVELARTGTHSDLF